MCSERQFCVARKKSISSSLRVIVARDVERSDIGNYQISEELMKITSAKKQRRNNNTLAQKRFYQRRWHLTMKTQSLADDFESLAILAPVRFMLKL